MKPLATIEVPQFITRVKLSDKQQTKYYKRRKGKSDYPRNFPKTYEEKLRKGIYSLDSRNYLKDENGDKIVANPRTAGKPKYEKLSGNNLLSGYGSPHIRAQLVIGLKDFYRPFVQDYIREHGPITTFPLRVTWDLYTTVKEGDNWDVSNLFFYYKYFEDSLHESSDDILYKGEKLQQLIPDDNLEYITWAPEPKLIPVDNWDDRKFIFKFYHDNRNELNRRPWVSPET